MLLVKNWSIVQIFTYNIFMLVKRNIENQIINVAETFPALILTGSRQVGKSTLLKYLADEKKIKINSYVTLDDYNDLKLAIDDPEEFFLKYKTPLVIDEIQKAPQLFQMIKKIIDKEPKNGLFFLTGSESFGLMKNVSETLAGRVAILELLPFSTTEINQYKNGIFLPTTFKNYNDKSMTQDDICNIIYKGLFPKITIEKNIDIDLYYESYIKTYIERDLRQFINIKNLMKFRNFLSTVAVRSGCELIIDELAKDNDIDNKTVLL
jgi:predicted AAA+ superfamily ATPase